MLRRCLAAAVAAVAIAVGVGADEMCLVQRQSKPGTRSLSYYTRCRDYCCRNTTEKVYFCCDDCSFSVSDGCRSQVWQYFMYIAMAIGCSVLLCYILALFMKHCAKKNLCCCKQRTAQVRHDGRQSQSGRLRVSATTASSSLYPRHQQPSATLPKLPNYEELFGTSQPAAAGGGQCSRESVGTPPPMYGRGSPAPAADGSVLPPAYAEVAP